MAAMAVQWRISKWKGKKQCGKCVNVYMCGLYMKHVCTANISGAGRVSQDESKCPASAGGSVACSSSCVGRYVASITCTQCRQYRRCTHQRRQTFAKRYVADEAEDADGDAEAVVE